MLCEEQGIEIVIVNRLEQEMAEDVLEIIPVFPARRYALRSHKTQKLLEDVWQ